MSGAGHATTGITRSHHYPLSLSSANPPSPPPKNSHSTESEDCGMSDDSPGTASSLSSPETRETLSPHPHPQRSLKIEDDDSDLHPSVIIKPTRHSSELSDIPLDFSLKPKKPPPNLHIEASGRISRNGDSQVPKPGSGRSAFEAVSPHPPGSFSGLPTLPNLAMGPLTGFDPAFLAAAANASLPIGSPLLTSSFNAQGLTSVFENGSNFSNRQQGRSSSPPPKVTRPFKAYNPTDPSSALQLSGQLAGFPQAGLGTASSLSATDNFLAQYRQYLLNAQAAILRARANGPNAIPPNNVSSVIAQALNGQKPKSLSGSSQGSLTPSPPQVTSTSHPHFEEIIPPRGSILLKSAKSVDLGNIIRATQAANQQSEKVVTAHSASTEEPRNLAAPEKETDSDGSGSSAAARRQRGQSLPEELKDQAYWERRRKNNEAAKRSRDMRRQKEDEIAMRAAILEQENLRLRLEVQQLKAETEKLRQILLNS